MKPVVFAAIFAFSTVLSTTIYAAVFTPADQDAYQVCSWEMRDPYLCAQEAVEALRRTGPRGASWRDSYTMMPIYIGDAVIATYQGHDTDLTPCDVAYHLAAFSWWETSFTPDKVGSAGERGMTQVLNCETDRYPPGRVLCDDSGYKDFSRTRPSAAWLERDPRNALMWTAGYLQDGDLNFRKIRRYNGGGSGARAYARRHLASVERINEWLQNPTKGYEPLYRGIEHWVRET